MALSVPKMAEIFAIFGTVPPLNAVLVSPSTAENRECVEVL